MSDLEARMTVLARASSNLPDLPKCHRRNSHGLIHSGFLLGLLFEREDGNVPLKRRFVLDQTPWRWTPEDTAFLNHKSKQSLYDPSSIVNCFMAVR
jgi:hypothetical protein